METNLNNTDYDSTMVTDVLVVGSGGGGLTAALMAENLGNDVMIIEKSNQYGGSTAISGGSIWIPNNLPMREKNIPDSLDDAN